MDNTFFSAPEGVGVLPKYTELTPAEIKTSDFVITQAEIELTQMQGYRRAIVNISDEPRVAINTRQREMFEKGLTAVLSEVVQSI